MTIHSSSNSYSALTYFSDALPPERAADSDATTSATHKGKRGAAYNADLWPQHSTIKISLLNMTDKQEELTKASINKWSPHINLKLEFIDGPDGDIRIAANNNYGGGSSAIGRQANDFPKSEPTMTIGFGGEDDAYTGGTIMHEFGHALGLHHEHQHPDNTLDFDMEKLYQEFARRNFTREQTDQFVLDPLNRENLIFLGYDQDSIMNYGFGEGTLRNRGAAPRGNDLSRGDIEFAEFIYPKSKINISDLSL